MNSKPLILVLLLCLVNFNFADNWITDGTGGAYWQNSNYKISVYPATIYGGSKLEHVQYVNFSSNATNQITINLSFVFNTAIAGGKVELWKTTRSTALYNIDNVSSFLAVANPICSIGDTQDANFYNVSFGNGTSKIVCFDSYSNIGNNYTINATKNNTGWVDISSSFTYSTINGRQIYTINNVQFSNPTLYQTRFTFRTPNSESGKYDIYAYQGTPQGIADGSVTPLLVLDPFWGVYTGVETIDGSYTVITFNQSGTLNFTTGMTVNATVLVIAGGAGGRSGGGGAGGVNYSIGVNNSILRGNISVTVGLGGSGAVVDLVTNAGASNGGNSSFGSLLTAIGGGAGSNTGNGQPGAAANGGSGGGAGSYSNTHLHGNGTVGQGYNGSDNPVLAAPYPSGAGGGCNGNAFGGGLGIASDGGPGCSYNITNWSGSNISYAGGGAGGCYQTTCTVGVGGSNIGGNGSVTSDGGGGINGTGSGGGGTGSGFIGGRGGDGIVIVRFLTPSNTSNTVLITQNKTVNSTLFPTMQMQWNITANNSINSTLNLVYNLTKNGAVAVGPVTLLVSNNAPVLINLSGNLTVGDNWTIFVQANDGLLNYSSINHTPNTTVLDPFTSIGYLANETSSSVDTMNATTINAGTDVICNLTYNNTQYPNPTKNTSVQNITYIQSVAIPGVYVPTIVTGNWICLFTSPYQNVTENRSFSNTIIPSIFALCNATITTNTINYSFFDQTTLAPLNVTFSAAYSYNGLSTSITNQSNKTFVCISPSNLNVSAVASETANYTGYQTNSVVRPTQYYSNQSIDRKIYLIPTSSSIPITIIVYNSNSQPLFNYTVLLYKYYPQTNTYNLTNSGTTNNQGQVVFFVEGAPTQYAGAVLDNNAILQQNTSGIIFCTNVPAGQSCTYAFYLGAPVNPNYYSQPPITNNGSQSIYTTFNGLNTIAVAAGPFCTFTNATMALFCSFPNATGTPNFLGTNLTLYNYTNPNNITQLITLQSNGTSQTLTVPNVTGNYYYGFYSNNINTTAGYTFTYQQVIETGNIWVNPPPVNVYGTDGWILAVIMVVGVSFATYRIPVIFVISTCAVMLLTSLIGLITLSGYTQAFILIVGIGVAYYVRD